MMAVRGGFFCGGGGGGGGGAMAGGGTLIGATQAEKFRWKGRAS